MLRKLIGATALVAMFGGQAMADGDYVSQCAEMLRSGTRDYVTQNYSRQHAAFRSELNCQASEQEFTASGLYQTLSEVAGVSAALAHRDSRCHEVRAWSTDNVNLATRYSEINTELAREYSTCVQNVTANSAGVGRDHITLNYVRSELGETLITISAFDFDEGGWRLFSRRRPEVLIEANGMNCRIASGQIGNRDIQLRWDSRPDGAEGDDQVFPLAGLTSLQVICRRMPVTTDSVVGEFVKTHRPGSVTISPNSRTTWRNGQNQPFHMTWEPFPRDPERRFQFTMLFDSREAQFRPQRRFVSGEFTETACRLGDNSTRHTVSGATQVMECQAYWSDANDRCEMRAAADAGLAGPAEVSWGVIADAEQYLEGKTHVNCAIREVVQTFTRPPEASSESEE
tara:strand:+ start:18809 stop:20005 length:1197 start_codon:yes stop_codon:yes gene_type:complete